MAYCKNFFLQNHKICGKSGFCDPCVGGSAGEVGVDEAVEVAVHHGVDIADFGTRSMILDHGVWMKNIRTDLASPGDLGLVALDILDFVQVLPLFDLYQLGAQHLQTGLLILELAPLGLAGNHNARSLVDQTNGGGGLVDMLSTGAGGAVDLHLVVLGADLHILAVILDLGAKLVCRRALASKGDTRTRRWTPFSPFKKP